MANDRQAMTSYLCLAVTPRLYHAWFLRHWWRVSSFGLRRTLWLLVVATQPLRLEGLTGGYGVCH